MSCTRWKALKSPLSCYTSLSSLFLLVGLLALFYILTYRSKSLFMRSVLFTTWISSFVPYSPECRPERDSSSDSKPDMPPPPSPASSTCSDHSGPVLSRSKYRTHVHWVQSKHHKVWFSTKTCSCYSTKTYFFIENHNLWCFDCTQWYS